MFIRFVPIGLACLAMVTVAEATLPRVLWQGPDLGSEFTAALGAGISLVETDAQVLLLGDLGDEGALTKTLEAARRDHQEVLWYSPPAETPVDEAANRETAWLMERNGVMTVDFAAYCRSLLPKGALAGTPLDAKARRRQGEFLAEAVNQWWAACATTNANAEHVRLWPETPPAYEYAGPERVNRSARIDHVSEPELVRFLPKKRERAPAVIFFPGGGYGYIGFLRNAKELAERLDAQGIAVIGLKYRMGRPVEVPLLDAERAVRYVRTHAAEWGIDPNRIGVAGQSAGANLVLNLASRFDAGDARAVDLVERASSRPDFMVVLTSWNFGKTVSTFTFPADTPPVFLRHAKNDSGFAIAEQVVGQLKDRAIPLDYLFLETGGHGAFELSPENPGAGWPDDLVVWLRQRGLFGRAQP
jgi:hypothetical protein